MTGPPGPASPVELRPVANDIAMFGLDAFVRCVTSFGTPADEARAQLGRYLDHFRLMIDGRGPGFVDSTGEWHPVPPEVVRLVSLNMLWTHGIPGAVSSDTSKWLVLLDGGGRVALRLPNYGWYHDALERWGQAAGWDTELTLADFRGDAVDREKAFPGFRLSPVAPVGQAYTVPVSAGQRLRRRLFRKPPEP